MTGLPRYCLEVSALVGILLAAFFALVLVNPGFDVTEGRDALKLGERIVAGGGIAFNSDPGGVFAAGPDGRFYHSHEIGNALLLLPATALARVAEQGLRAWLQWSDLVDTRSTIALIASFHAPFYVAMTAAGFFFGARVGLHFSVKHSIEASAMLIGSTTLVAYSRGLFDGVAALMRLSWAYALAFAYRRTGDPLFFLPSAVCC